MFRLSRSCRASLFLVFHAAAVVITAICMPVALYWFLSSDVRNLQQRALQAQTKLFLPVTSRRDPTAAGRSSCPRGCRSNIRRRTAATATSCSTRRGACCSTSRKDTGAIFPVDAHATEIAFPEVHLEDLTLTGASVRKRVGNRFVCRSRWRRTLRTRRARRRCRRQSLQECRLDHPADPAPAAGYRYRDLRRAVQPLLRASDRAEHISPTRTDVRLPTDDIPSEIRPLVIAVNQALDRLEQGFRRLREFTADAAHELRTPLSVLRMRIDTLPDRPTADALRGNVEGMSRVVSQLLDAAELEMLVVIPHEKADLRAVCAEVAEFIAPLALAQGKTLALSGAGGSGMGPGQHGNAAPGRPQPGRERPQSHGQGHGRRNSRRGAGHRQRPRPGEACRRQSGADFRAFLET